MTLGRCLQLATVIEGVRAAAFPLGARVTVFGPFRHAPTGALDCLLAWDVRDATAAFRVTWTDDDPEPWR